VAGDRRVVRTTIAEGHLAAGRTALRGLLQLWAIAPSRVRIADRPVGRVLRDFYQALVVGDRQMAESALDEIRSRGLLSATNVRFLLVDLLSATGTASELRTDSRLAGISLVERPPRVTESLAQAAGQLFFHWTGDIQSDDVKRIALDLEDCWPNLVTSRSQAVSLATARCLAAVEALADEQRPGVLRFLAASPWSDDPFVAAVAHETAPSEPSVTIDPYQLLVSGELEEALDAAIELGHSDVFTVAVFAAYELGTVEAAKAALGFFERLDQSAVAGVTAGRVVADRLEALREKLAETEAATDWVDWLQHAGDGGDLRLDLLRDWAKSLPVDLAFDAVYLEGLTTELFDALNDGRRGPVRNALPLIIESFFVDGELAPQCVGAAILTAQVVLASDAGTSEREIALVLADQVFECGCTADEYEELLVALMEHFAVLGARAARFLADAVSLVVDGPGIAEDVRANFYAQAVAAATGMVDRLDSVESIVLQQALAAAGIPFEVPHRDAGDVVSGEFRPVSVSIYSLAESAARRAADWIVAARPGVEIHISNDKVNSDRLAAMVRSSDAVLVHTSKATHAATNAISAAATEQNEIVWVNGRGASSIFRAFLDWVGA
jgi:hypothetical protein